MSSVTAVDMIGASEGSLEDLYDHAPCGQLSTTPDGAVVKVNHTFLDWTGYTNQQVVGRSLDSLLATGSQLLWETRCLPILRLTGQLREVALAITTADGGLLPVLLNASLVAGPNGDPRLIRIVVFDASERQDYERDLLHARRAAERSEAQVRILQTASATFDAARSPADVATSLAQIARTAFDATAAAVMFIDTSTGTLRSAGEGHNPIGDTVRLDSSRPEAEALRSGRFVRIAGLDEAEQMFPDVVGTLEGARLAAMCAVPLLENGAAGGVLACFYGRRRDIDDDEVQLQQALTRQAGQALHRIRLYDELHHMAQHDGLTGLANRVSLRTRLGRVLAGATRDQRPMAVIFLDLDGFKAINDQLGHAIGDAVLIEVAERLRTAVRQSDTVARFGGDEFVVVCADTDRHTAVTIADRIRQAVRQPLHQVPPSLPLTVSIGVALHHPAGGDSPEPDAMVRSADTAMYQSKREGKDRNTVVQT